MIRYSLKCAEGHSFDSWFQSAEAFESLTASGHLTCAICGGTEVEKAIMAPGVAKTEPAEASGPLSAPASPAEQAVRHMREYLEKNSTYVGGEFADEARKIHLGDAPDRLIHGEAKPEEARALIEDGVPIAPIPGLPKSKAN